MNRRAALQPPARLSLRRLLNHAQLRSMLLAMGLAGLSLTLLGVLALRSYAEHHLQLLARSLSYTLEAAVVFHDASAALESLERIASGEEIAHVRVLGREGHALAEWRLSHSGPWISLERRIADALLQQPLVQPIRHQGRTVGELHLSSQGGSLTRFLRNGTLTLLGCLLLSSVMAYYGSRRVQRKIMTPLQHLSDVANSISRERTFTQRVPTSRIAELDDLAENFNRLLDEIEAWQNQLQRENASLAHQASHDSLTGLPNRSQFEPALARAAREADNNTGRFAVMFIDCNRFKQINDDLGHAAGDQVLTSIAERLRAQLREDDLVARLGGDEFAVLLKPLHQDGDAILIADKILASMDTPIALPDGGSVQASLSIGVALYPDHADSLDALVHQADVAMYHAKRNQGGYRLARRGITQSLD